MRLKNSYYHLERALKVVPEGSQTKSKMANRFPENFPKFISHGKGSHVWDVDGNEYIDWVMGLGPIILGHANDDVVNDVYTQANRGNVFALPSIKEYELAELLKRHIPCAEMSRFARNGGDATMGAVRLARAITGKIWVIYTGYHGGHDWIAQEIIPNAGTTNSMTCKVQFNDIEELKTRLEFLETMVNEGTAAVIMEVPPDEPKDDYLQKAIDLAHEHGALFILDEVVTGLRYGMGGAQEKYGIVPDLACFSKGLGNGFPISAICGKAEYMERFNDIFFSTTFGGELTGIQAALTTVELCYENDVADHIDRIGSELREKIKWVIKELEINAELKGNSARSILEFKDDPDMVTKTVFLQEVVKRGVLMGVPIFPCFAHTMDDVNQTIRAIERAFLYIRKHENEPDKGLIGKPISLIGSPRK
ncbi:MAG: aminotransferase class III-fold pyridoxal phosphate-dependent enzyme [Syntrophorhabdaceae bacterium]|nr:aminotransferase class III-fold pyridoxal phosphate-dependent enzyme [Syntrophorhabdaceae bacterium]